MNTRRYLPSVQALVAAAKRAWPDQPLRIFRVVDTGWTNLMLEADGRLMFRFPRWPGAARSLATEARLLEVLARRISAQVPDPVRVGSLDEPRGWPFLVYRKLPGRPMGEIQSLSTQSRARLTRFLVQFFAQLASIPALALRQVGLSPGDKATWTAEFKSLERRYLRSSARRVAKDLHGEITREFAQFFSLLADARYRPTLLHHDLWPNHILWDRGKGRPVGVIDWDDARFGDPAFDLRELRGLDIRATRAIATPRRSPHDHTFEQRLLFYRRIGPLRGLLFGLETGQVLLARKALGTLRTTLRAESL